MIWISFIFILLIVFALISVVKTILRKVFNIEKEKKEFFFYNHINELHRKIDWVIRIAVFITTISATFYMLNEDFSINLLLFIYFFNVVIEYGVRAFFEWKYLGGSKRYILTISEGVILALVIAIVIDFDLLSYV
ncbi:DUF4181 domain-containing protein [Psychrobacillus sp. FJAT-21963]|uniref:DUF4181 domain-containing protein n=1 Tax=Psychrobacillus sp. FJAT-21963 TaxID=1712028 RepID=UPI0007011B09|nr:DUF4181 domain-containing protein [Psychrobacillus sp. FJAT-21963]KQL35279.1 hypothetical protein AN959_10110 [Psychrobacillus sp. FJAT-21963]